MTHPGVGPITALAFVLDHRGRWNDSQCGKQIGSYVGLIPCGRLQCGPSTHLGHITKQGSSPLLRFLLGEAAQAASALRCTDWRRLRGMHLALRRATEHCQGGHGPKTRSAVVLDVAEGLGIFQDWSQIRFARGTAPVPEMVCSRTPST